MVYILGGTKKTIPFSMFKEGKAEEIFEEVKRSGSVKVMKDSKEECVIVSPDEYAMITADHDDIRLLAIAEERMKHFDRSKLISAEELYKELGITDEDLEGWEEVELE